jgi:hypothetical protein
MGLWIFKAIDAGSQYASWRLRCASPADDWMDGRAEGGEAFLLLLVWPSAMTWMTARARERTNERMNRIESSRQEARGSFGIRQSISRQIQNRRRDDYRRWRLVEPNTVRIAVMIDD